MMANSMLHNCISKASRVNNFTASGFRYKSTVAQMAAVHDHGNTNRSDVTTHFAKAKVGTFFQAQPHLGNQFLEDVTLQKYLQRYIPDTYLGEINEDLERFAERISTSINTINRECEVNPPLLQHYDAWGKRIDKIITSQAWKQMKVISAEEGLIAIAYERKHHEWSRLYQMAKIFLFAPSSGVYQCPLAMTDGAAKSIEIIGKDGLLGKAYRRLISRDPEQFWTSGQWMTERKGGSDVAAGTQTVAVKQHDNSYKLNGYKWFSSATDSDMALTLARVCDENGQFLEGTRGLSMFYLEVRNSDGVLNSIEVQRLKDKLGTRAVPTAELLLDGTKAFLVSNEGHGVASIANMLTLTRIHNAVTSAASMRRIISLARDFSRKRECFGKTIDKHALHVKTIANMEVEARAATLLTLELSRLLGLDDCQKITAIDKDMLRLLTPVAKLYTAKQAVAVVSEGLECFGGMGYMEDSGLPVLLRDAQVLPIWEGTTNILSLDVLRAIYKSQGSVLKSFTDEVLRRLATVRSTGSQDLHNSVNKVEGSLQETLEFAKKNGNKMDIAARDFSYSLARIYMGLLLLEHASWSGATIDDTFAANRWCQQDLSLVSTQSLCANYDVPTSDLESRLVFAGYSETSRL